MVDSKKINIFDATFLLDSDRHPVGTRLIRKVRNGWGHTTLVESVINEYSPSGTAVLLTTSSDLTESPDSKMWFDVGVISQTIFDVIENKEKESKQTDPETTATFATEVRGYELPNNMTLQFINPFKKEVDGS